MTSRAPELQMSYAPNSLPVSAKCSVCGEKMFDAFRKFIAEAEKQHASHP
jgi:hypothetical protein